MRILITGGLGVNGAVVLRQLVEQGIRPTVLDFRPDFSLVEAIKSQFDFVRGDVLQSESLVELMREIKPEAIIHLAAHISPDMDNEPYRSFQVNGQGTANMLEAARQSGVRRFVAASSRAVYGAMPEPVGGPDYQLITEDFPKFPLKSYDVTKLAAEQLGCVYASVFGLEYAGLRFSGIYGPGKQARHGKMSLRSRIVEDPYVGKPVRISGGGDQLDDMIYVEDASAALVSATLAPKLRFNVYNIASGVGRTMQDMADAVKKCIPDADIEVGPGGNPLGFDVNRAAIFDISRAKNDFGFTPQYDLNAGVRDYVERLKAANFGS